MLHSNPTSKCVCSQRPDCGRPCSSLPSEPDHWSPPQSALGELQSIVKEAVLSSHPFIKQDARNAEDMTGYQFDANIYKQISVEIKYKLLERRVTILVPLRLPHPNDARNHRNLLRRSSSHFPASFAAQSPWSQGLGGLKGEQIGGPYLCAMAISERLP